MSEQQQHDAAEEAIAQDVLERGLTHELIEVSARKPIKRDADLEPLKHFVQHCRALGITPLPATPAITAAYLLILIYENQSERAVAKAATAIEHAHDTHGYANPIATRVGKAVLRLNKRHSRTQEIQH